MEGRNKHVRDSGRSGLLSNWTPFSHVVEFVCIGVGVYQTDILEDPGALIQLMDVTSLTTTNFHFAGISDGVLLTAAITDPLFLLSSSGS